MGTFTCLTLVRNSFHVTQHIRTDPEAALRDHIAALPYDDGTGPLDEELEWLQEISGGIKGVQLIALDYCKGTWMWLDGARFEPQYLTYIVKTDISQ
jgi:hypothetical protein